MSTGTVAVPLAQKRVPPPFKFTTHPSSSPFTVNSQAYLRGHPDSKFNYMATAAVVFDNADPSDPRILLVQRSPLDSWPNCWEIPGGACDDDDQSILHGVARELWEETGLVATRIGPTVGDVHLFVSRSGRQIGKFIFFAEVEKDADGKRLKVKLRPDEHQNFVWANEADVRAKMAGKIELEFTSKVLEATIIQAFQWKKENE
jgi:8-oxo-dGTP pyrophosphatase MutT (NUDIX family)